MMILIFEKKENITNWLNKQYKYIINKNIKCYGKKYVISLKKTCSKNLIIYIYLKLGASELFPACELELFVILDELGLLFI